ncbi:hypothetical protein BH10PSE17_BH10PSE17_12710 [soil metagenome]
MKPTVFGRALAAAALLMLLPACGAMKIGYNHADTVGLYYLDQYFALDDDQEVEAKSQLRALVAWHRQHELPVYAQRIAVLKTATTREATSADLDGLDEDLSHAFDRVLAQAAPGAIGLLGGLNDDQVDHLRKRFAKDNDKFKSDWVTPSTAKLRDKLYDRTLEQLERWYGDFSSAQKQQIRTWSDERPYDGQLALAERERRQREFIALVGYLRQHPPQVDALKRAREFAAHWESVSPGATDPAKATAQRDAAMTMIVKIANIATPDQRKTAADRLQKWIDDLNALSKSGA